jgi:presequence protease
MNNGFKLIEERFIKEIDARGTLYIHEKSGARLFHIENDDDNKVFSISFKTPPIDNTGLTHILEHSVLSGSRKFPTKEPFVDLAKGSLNTFLNALTFKDKTMYPVASKNEKDFYNLIDVYMDAVFYPKIYETPEIFMQEGWHYDISSREESITYKGVVYNEMLGAFSSPEEILFSRIMGTLYPDTSYGFEAGGNPDFMTELTYEKFLGYHKKYYHPSNSYIYLYGNGDINEQLKFLDEKYLCDFDRASIDSELKSQMKFTETIERTFTYPVSSVEEEEDSTYLSLNYVTGIASDVELSIGFDILEYILLETPASPLKKALIDAEIGKDVMGNFDEGLLQPMFNIVLKDSNPEEKKSFIKIVQKTLRSLVSNKIDKKLIEASINSLEFKFREANGEDTPKGLLFGIRCMDSWLYSENPFTHLEYESALNSIKEKSMHHYFEALIEKYLLNNTHSSIVVLEPKYGLAEERTLAVNDKLKTLKDSLSTAELDKLIDDNKRLLERQITPDSSDNLEKIPLIALEDISKVASMPPIEVRVEKGTKILYHNLYTNKIIYFDLLFDTSCVEQELLPYIGLLSDVLGMVSTKKHSYEELSNEIDIHTGGIGFNIEVYEEVDSSKYHPKFIIETKALNNKLSDLVDLINEILNNSKFNNKKRLLEILRETKADIEVELIEDGHSVAVKRLCSYFSNYASYVELLTGISYYNFISDLEIDYDNKYHEIVKNLEKVSKKIFNKANLIVSLVCGDSDYEHFKKTYPQFVDKISNHKSLPVDYKFQYFQKNEGIINSANVQFVAKGYNYRELGYSYSGYLQVLKNILSLDYLWNRVRVQGGAYGAFSRFEMSGNSYFVSYRDPNLENTLKVYDGIKSYISNFEISVREMTKYIIGTISSFDQPLTPSQAGQRADEMYFRNITAADMQRERDEVLNTNIQEIRKLAQMIDDVLRQNYLCVIGNEGVIRENAERFDRVYNVFSNN